MDNGYKVSKITIYGLFDNKKVEVDFSETIQIFTGENGTGKTTILNIVYNALTLNFDLLQELPFDIIVVDFTNQKTLMLKREWLEEVDGNYSYVDKNLITKQMAKILNISSDTEVKGEGKKNTENLKKLSRLLYNDNYSYNHEKILTKLDKLDEELLSRPMMEETILENYLGEVSIEYHYAHEELGIDFVLESEMRVTLFRYILSNFYKEKIVYFPTYRRIEEELSKIQSSEEVYYEFAPVIHGPGLISFGLSDVESLFESIENEIKEFNLEGYSQINAQLLTYMLNTEPITSEMIDKINDKNAVQIVLDRMEENTLNKKDKTLIQKKLSDMDFLEAKSGTDTVIIYFLYKLIERYEMKSEQEDAIKKFVSICNKYLVNKEFIYNQSKIKIEVVNKENGNKIELRYLSSGEKQIISTFAKLLLIESEDENEDVELIIIDEPELSLSVEWQMMFLPDIIASRKCGKLLAVTHSPFIYRNSLKQYAKGLKSIISNI